MKFLKEPVVHFALFGIFLFVYYYQVSDPQDRPARTGEIVVTETQVAQLIQQFESVWVRRPNPQELDLAIAAYVRDEILVREALALGLDRGDAAIRARLRQKMLYLNNSMARMMDPSDDLLTAYIQDNPDRFSVPAQLAFEQVFLGQSVTEQTIADSRAALLAGADPAEIGQRSMMPANISLSGFPKINAIFGAGFAQAVATQKPGEWGTPVESGYGFHLTRITRKQPATLLDLQTSRDLVVGEWRDDQSKVLAEAQLAAMQERYEVILPEAAQIKATLDQ